VFKNILVAPNSHKECADSVEISKIICDYLAEKSSFKIISKPLSDGGDGFLNVCKSVFYTKPLLITIDNDFDETEKEYTILFDHESKNIFIESAELFGLKLIEETKRNPLLLNSSVLGKIITILIQNVNQKKLDIQTVWIGVGGTATIDLGIGACSQLGLSLLDRYGNALKAIPKYFNEVSSVKFNNPNLPFKIKCVVDVETELIGEPGAIEIYGKQKGASSNDLKIIKGGIKNILGLISKDLKFSIPEKLNGAGGGLATGLNIFLNAEIIPAEKFIMEYLLRNINLDKIDVVISGEGSFDSQSFEGKGSGVLLDLFKHKSIPIFLINGSTCLPENIKLPKNITVINTIDFFNSKEESIKNFQSGIVKATEIVINHLTN
jgi:glycerate 2-kinase